MMLGLFLLTCILFLIVNAERKRNPNSLYFTIPFTIYILGGIGIALIFG